MVVSKIDTSITYSELFDIAKQDKGKQHELYQIEVKNVEIIIAIGSTQKTLELNNIIFFPIYLVDKNKKCYQIGVFEIYFNDYATMYNDNGELVVENLDDPLIYSFIDSKWLHEHRLEPDLRMNDYDKDTDGDDFSQNQELSYRISKTKSFAIPKERENLFILAENTPNHISVLEEETFNEAQNIRQKYHVKDGDNWMQQYMKNPHYSIEDVESNGDCFFATIRQAFASIGQITTVEQLRTRLTQEIDENLLEHYKELFNSIDTEWKLNKSKLSEIKTNFEELKQLKKNTINSDEQISLGSQIDKLKQQAEVYKNELKMSGDLIKEYKFMKGVKTIEQMKRKILQSDYWADNWSITTMEGALNIKLILMSSQEYYENKGSSLVINCGQLNKKFLNDNQNYNPEFYLILE